MTDAGKMDTNSQFQEIWEILGKNAYTHKSYSEDPNSCLGSALSDHEEEEEEEAGKQQQQQQQHYGMTSKSSSPDEEQKDNKEPKRESRVSPEENGEEETGHKQFKLPKTSTFLVDPMIQICNLLFTIMSIDITQEVNSNARINLESQFLPLKRYLQQLVPMKDGTF